MKKVLAATAAAVATISSVGIAAPKLAQAASCTVTWGSTAKTFTSSNHGSLTGLRTGQHYCFDRLVLDGGTPSGRVRYVTAVRDQGRGAVVPLRGGAFLQIDVQEHAYRRPAMPNVTGYRTFRQVGWGGSFEGYTTVGLGVRARLPFRVFKVGDDRLVIDVAHRW